jgi:hypothetical protein
VGVGSAAVVQQFTWEEALRAGRVLFGTQADALLGGGGWRDELKRAYKRRVLETHPDRARTLGRAEAELSREFQAVAAAYQLLQEAPEVGRWLRARPQPPASRRPPVWTPNAEDHRARSDADQRRAERVRQAEQARQQAERSARAGRRTEQAQREERDAQARRGESARREAAAKVAAARAEEAARAEREVRSRRVWTASEADWRHVVKPRPMPRRRIRLAEFLYYSGRISWAAMVEAISWQRQQRPAVGRIAVEFGFLTPVEVMEVIERRRRAGASDVPFGEFALRIGMITQFERLAMVGRQTRLQRPIGQFFVERGLIVEPEFDELRRQIVRHNLRHYVRSAT